MRKIYFILAILFAVTLTSCESNDEKNIRLKQENAELQASNEKLSIKNEQLKSAIYSRRNEVVKLDEQIKIKNVQKTGKNVRFFVTLKIKQTTYTLDIGEHFKNSLNSIEMTIETSEDFYFSVKKGQELSSNFKKGSFFIDGDVSELNITVTNKYTK